MVVFTIAEQNNGETVYFEEPIPKVHFIRLLSCSLYNSWHTLKNKGSAELGDKDAKAKQVSKIPPGHYTLESLAKKIDVLFDKYNYRQIETETNQMFWLDLIQKGVLMKNSTIVCLLTRFCVTVRRTPM